MHVVLNQKVPDKVIDNFKSLDMFRNESLGFLLFGESCLFETGKGTSGGFFDGGVDEVFELVHVVNALVDEIEVFKVIKVFSNIRVTAHFHLLDHINVLLFV